MITEWNGAVIVTTLCMSSSSPFLSSLLSLLLLVLLLLLFILVDLLTDWLGRLSPLWLAALLSFDGVESCRRVITYKLTRIASLRFLQPTEWYEIERYMLNSFSISTSLTLSLFSFLRRNHETPSFSCLHFTYTLYPKKKEANSR